MAQTARIAFSGGVYHVMARGGNQGQAIRGQAMDRRMVLDTS